MSSKNDMQAFWDNSYLFGGNTPYLEEMYESYLVDPTSIPESWQNYFKNLPNIAEYSGEDFSHEAIKEHFISIAKQPNIASASCDVQSQKQANVSKLIEAFRSHGHHHAKLDPLELRQRQLVADLDLGHHGFSQADMQETFFTDSFAGIDAPQAKLSEIYQALEKIYCGSIGIEFMHISDHEQTQWLQTYVEKAKGKPLFNQDEKLTILNHLCSAEGLETYLGKKYVGQKRFSVEGSDSLIPMLNAMVSHAAKTGAKELVVGMAHRGRLNVLVNMLGKSPSMLFQEFEGVYHDEDRSGDVKYHLGFSSNVKTKHGTIHLALGFNPSHLEIISPVVEGAVRARQDRRKDTNRDQVIPISIHGDAAFAGQGVVMETFNMSQARGYSTGGTVHIVINNQIGFTTSNPLDSRSTLYCTDVAKMVQAPIIHVNGDDVESVVFASLMAFDFRNKFKKDIVIDLVSYRRHGHNESDEPTITQPVMYQKVKAHPTPLTIYANKLMAEGILNQESFDKLVKDYRDILDAGKNVVELEQTNELVKKGSPWKKYGHTTQSSKVIKTGVTMEKLTTYGQKLTTIPDNFTIQPLVKREYANREKMMAGEQPLFWGMAETLAYASLVDEGYAVRLSGQDSGRGTFSHRHAVLHDYKNADIYTPLSHISDTRADFTVIDSVLSEEAVLAFEYGYAGSYPDQLVIWEAQFGDFFNGAQVVIDQFISSGEQKWGRLSSLVLFLPHGYEGMGPEHSSARLERFLQLCAQENMQVCVPTTPAQAFHMIRRQMIAEYRKPLVVMTPKSLLRHKLAVSTLEDLETGYFMELIPEQNEHNTKDIRHVIVCSGKVYYDLIQYRETNKRNDVAIIRVEQLYPFPEDLLATELARYKNAKSIVWCQEEPKNQGAWYNVQHHIQSCLYDGQQLSYAGRLASAAPAVGYQTLHAKQQTALVEEAFASVKSK